MCEARHDPQCPRHPDRFITRPAVMQLPLRDMSAKKDERGKGTASLWRQAPFPTLCWRKHEDPCSHLSSRSVAHDRSQLFHLPATLSQRPRRNGRRSRLTVQTRQERSLERRGLVRSLHVSLNLSAGRESFPNRI